MINTPGIYEIPATEYHSDPCPEPSLSASVARTLIDRSPLHAWMQHPKLGNQQEEKPAARLSLGSAAHSVILQGDWDSIGFIDKDSFRTNAAKEQRDEILAAGGTPLLEKDRSRRSRRWSPNFAERAGIDRSGFETERTLIWQDRIPPESEPIWCRARVDLLGDRLILDLKTTAVPATPERWGRNTSLGLRDAVRILPPGLDQALNGGKPPAFRFIVQETTPPYSVAQFSFDGAGLDYADYLAEQAVWKWGECIKAQSWPSYAAGVNVMEAPVLGARETGGGIMTKHTPGPWRVTYPHEGGWFVVCDRGRKSDCGNGFDGYGTDPASRLECQANAHLISDARETAAERDRLKSR